MIGTIRHSGSPRRTLWGYIALGAVLVSIAGVWVHQGAAKTLRSQSGRADGTITVALPYDISSFDPQTINSGYDGVLLTYDTLVGHNGKNQIVPQLADSWQVTPRQVSLHLRKGVTCQDGTRLTAGMVKASFERLLTLPAASGNKNIIFGPGKISVTANNKLGRITFTNALPNSDMLHGLGFFSAGVICPAGLRDATTLATHPAGTGPYVLTAAVKGASYTFSRRSKYTWGPAGASTNRSTAPKSIVLMIVTNATTASNMFNTGQVDIVSAVGDERDRLLREKNNSWTQRDTVTQKITLVFNRRGNHIGTDKAVRLAIAGAVDRGTYARLATGSSSNAGASYIASVTPCYSSGLVKSISKFDQNAAGEILKRDGWVRSGDSQWMKNGKPLTITLLTTDRVPKSEYIAAQLTEFGVKVQTQNLDLNSYVNALFSRPGGASWDVALLSAGAGNNFSPSTATLLLSGPVPPKGNNITGIFNGPVYRSIVKAQAHVGKQACAFWIEAQRRLLTQRGVVPMADVVKSWFGRGVAFELGLQGTLAYATIATK